MTQERIPMNHTCMNCYHEQVERKKIHQEPCNTCLKTGSKENPFPQWKAIQNKE